jgi:hypothetical protein
VRSLLDDYAANGNQQVEGWLLPTAVEIIRHLAGVQQELGIHGPACEIGVHHGRLFLLLHLLTIPPERSVAIDLFECRTKTSTARAKGAETR